MSSSSNTHSEPQPSVLEMEQKFTVSSDTVPRLKELGFEKVIDYDMVDWYYDFQQEQEEECKYPLIKRNAWLRYRQLLPAQESMNETKQNMGGQWQLKIGSEDCDPNEQTTSYREIVDDMAIKSVRAMNLPNKEWIAAGNELPNDNEEMDGLAAPSPPQELQGLSSFACIVTHRSSWKRSDKITPADMKNNSPVSAVGDAADTGDSLVGSPNSSSLSLSVDLDETNFGYNVGEVEIVIPLPRVATANGLADSLDPANSTSLSTVQQQRHQARRMIQELIDQLTGHSNQYSTEEENEIAAATGKLEYYLQRQRPKIFQILQQTGLVAWNIP